MAKTTLNHPSLGPLTGIARGKVQQFLGIRYATLAHRFSAPVLSANTPPDCTAYSPVPIQPLKRIEAEWGLIGQRLNTTPEAIQRLERQSETECLTLNITRPAEIPEGTQLPVFVFIHGGGYSQGASAWPQYDLAHFVTQSIELGKPLIAVSINYRTNIFGFLTVPTHATNRGLKDQKTAFLWLHEHVAAFGGDAARITAMGQSAGGISVSLHLRDPAPRFSRAVLMSGEATLFKPAPMAVHRQLFEAMCEGLGLGAKSEAEKVAALDTMDSAEMLASAPRVPYMPLLDGELFTKPITLDSVARKDEECNPAKSQPGWLDALMVGDVKDDGYILAPAVEAKKKGIGKVFADYASTTFGAQAQDVLDTYEISASTPDAAAADRIVLLLNDIAFYVPSVMTARGWPDEKPVYAYHFNCVNKWPDASLKGKSNHILDIAYLFGNYHDQLNDSDRAMAERFAESIITFANGEEPWEKFDSAQESIMVYGDGGAQVRTKAEEEKRERRKQIWQLIDSIGAEKLHAGVMGFLR